MATTTGLVGPSSGFHQVPCRSKGGWSLLCLHQVSRAGPTISTGSFLHSYRRWCWCLTSIDLGGQWLVCKVRYTIFSAESLGNFSGHSVVWPLSRKTDHLPAAVYRNRGQWYFRWAFERNYLSSRSTHMVIATFFSLFLSIVYYQVPSGEKKYKIHYGLRYSLWSLQKKKEKKRSGSLCCEKRGGGGVRGSGIWGSTCIARLSTWIKYVTFWQQPLIKTNHLVFRVLLWNRSVSEFWSAVVRQASIWCFGRAPRRNVDFFQENDHELSFK